MDVRYSDPHKPTTITDMAGASEWSRLNALVTNPDPQHIVCAGVAGIGKSCALRLCLKSAITIWLNCAQDPTLRENRDRIKAAARRRVEESHIHWIVLEHADVLHADAQAFLRRIIETNVGSSRFVLEVRDSASISEPLLSRTVLFNVQPPVPYEIQYEIQRRAPSISVEKAKKYARTCDGNIRWAILQGLGIGQSVTTLGENDGYMAESHETPTAWKDVLRIMESIYLSGSSPRAYSGKNITWDRPGGVCQWSLLALELSKTVQ